MKKNFFTVIILFSLMYSSAQERDIRIERQLKNLNLKYEIISSADFKLLFELESKRSQMVFIGTKTKFYEDAEVRQIYSPVKYISGTVGLSCEQLWILLANNELTVFGAWQLVPIEGGWMLHYSVKVPAMMPEKRLMMYMRFIAKIADDMELTFSSEDIY